MTNITQLAWLQIMFGSRILRIALLGVALIALQSSAVQAQWAGPTNNNLTTTNNVGIGTSSPGAKLHVYDASGTRTGVLMLGQNINILGEGGAILEVNTAGGGTLYISAYKPGVAYGNTVIQPEGGNVGIGTTAPTTKFHVAGDGKFTGNLTVDGNIAAKYQDVAEWVPASEQIPAGTVVVLDSTKSNQVVASSRSYDTRVAGVISAQPGITLGEAGKNKVLVATTGRVRIKVDASRGPIEIGDLLVTSDIPGLAMKSQPINVGGVQLHRPGTLLGKALEPLQKGMGEILVLLSLQ